MERETRGQDQASVKVRQLSALQKDVMKKGMPGKCRKLSMSEVLETAKPRLTALASCLMRC